MHDSNGCSSWCLLSIQQPLGLRLPQPALVSANSTNCSVHHSRGSMKPAQGQCLGKDKRSHQPLGTKSNFCWRGWVNLSGCFQQQGRDPKRRGEISEWGERGRVGEGEGEREKLIYHQETGFLHGNGPYSGSLGLSDSVAAFASSQPVSGLLALGSDWWATSRQRRPTTRQCCLEEGALDWESGALNSGTGSAAHQPLTAGKSPGFSGDCQMWDWPGERQVPLQV